MNPKIKSWLYYMLIALVMFATILLTRASLHQDQANQILGISQKVYQTETPSKKIELYPGQQAVLDIDAAHQWAREHVVPSTLAVEQEMYADISVYTTKQGIRIEHTTQKVPMILTGYATVVSDVQGYLLTAAHVVNKHGAEEFRKKLTAEVQKSYPNQYIDVQLIFYFHAIDVNKVSYVFEDIILGDDNELALFRIKDWKNFSIPPVEISSVTNLSDKSVVIIGGPLGINEIMMDGRIARQESVKNEEGEFIYVISSIVPGNSGGGAFTLSDGKLAGVVSQVMLTRDPPSFSNIGMLVPNTVVRKFLKEKLPKK